MSELRAAYRLQLGPELGFAEARALVPYLRDLGVSHLYLSPSLQARSGSSHGYDVVDPTRISEDLGGEAEFRSLAAAGLGVLLDIVPNHMAADEQNPWWREAGLRERFFDLDPDTGRHRRFFDVDDLAGVRVEDPEVFAVTHELVLRLVAEGVVHGVRVDHPDGLADPAGYLDRLRAAGVRRVWVEKILERGESLRDWPVEGTTGYDFLNDVAALWVDPRGEGTLDQLHAELTGERRPFHELAAEAKLEQAETTFRPEVERLRAQLDRPDLAEALAALPVYRSYVEPWSGRVEAADEAVVEGLPAALRRILLLEEPGHEAWVTRFQQTTPPVMAKGVEDTAFYRYTRLLSSCEVGGDPGRFGLSVDAFHLAQAERARRFPRGLLTTQTHDTKRSGDVRARIAALSGMADEWAEQVRRWEELTAGLREGDAPDGLERHLIWQTLVGAWPLPVERLEQYMEKALREAKRNTDWIDQDAEWEGAVLAFCRALYGHGPFLACFEPFAARVNEAGRRAALGQLLLKLTSPGVPDIYQGDELEALSLVDPDNRRTVDWERRRRLLAEVRGGAAAAPETAKLRLILRALDLRARLPEAFAGAYDPLPVGPDAVAFMRGQHVLVAVTLRQVGAAATIDPGAGSWRDALSGAPRPIAGPLQLGDLLDPDGIALLERL